MLRQLHSLLGLIGALLVILLGLSGAVLSTYPALDRVRTDIPMGLSVAELAGRIARDYPGAEQIQRTPSGVIIVYFSGNSGAGADRVDPTNGSRIAPHVPSASSRWIKQLHRSLYLDTAGRIATGGTALALLLLCVSGILLLTKRVGGWRKLSGPLYGSRSQRWHAAIGRFAVFGLLLSALTGIYMSAATFGLISDGMQAEPDFPSSTSGGPPVPAARLPSLMSTDLANLRELVYPIPGDRFAVYTLRTAQGDAYVDQSSGALLAYRAHGNVREIYELVYQLHTGEGLWWLGLPLGLCALGAPWLAVTGTIVWWRRQRAKPRIAGNSTVRSAETVILVGSENNSTWGFAQVLHEQLRKAGQRVHTAPMNRFSSEYRAARKLLILTATYGDGAAPASANVFLTRLARIPAGAPVDYAVLGFGDRQFPKFCQYASDVDAAMRAREFHPLLPLTMINRQSSQEFSRWGADIGPLLGCTLTLEHTPSHPKTSSLRLLERIDYGRQEREPTVVLRFVAGSASKPTGLFGRLLARYRLPRFDAGDLVGILAPASPMPRFYSLASGASNGYLEICVRLQPGGLCSTYLHGLQPGDCIEAFIQPNPQFRPATGRAPVILIGAGTGIGPLAGFIRNNTGRYPMYLYWGGRNPDSDFLYEPELRDYLADRRLTQLHTAFSRVRNGSRVQNRLADDAENLRKLIADGGQVLVCGSSAMASSVRTALDEVLAPLQLNVLALKASGRYREDVF